MAGIIIFIILAVGYALCGDTSGIEVIGKGILYIGLFIGVGCIIVYAPWLIFVGIGIFVLYLVLKRDSSVNQLPPTNSNNDYNLDIDLPDQKSAVTKNSDTDIANTQPSAFQKELAKNTKTHQQVEDENWLKEKEQIALIAKNDFTDIKRKLLNKAKNGQYSILSNKKIITLDYNCSYILSCIDRQYSHNYTGKIGTPSYKLNEKTHYYISKTKQYELYLSMMKGLALQDNIKIILVFVEINIPRHQENEIKLPYTFTGGNGMGVSSHKIKAYLKCSIQY